MHSTSLRSLLCCYVLILSFVLYYPKWKHPGTEATISYDVSGYYLYLPSIFIYHDIHQFDFYEDIHKTYHPTPSPEPGIKLPDGNYTMKYPIGAAVFYAPFFFAGHAVACITNYPADGYSMPYQFFISIGCLFYAFLGLCILRKILLRYFNESTVSITLFLFVAATNLLNYMAVDYALTHNLLFLLYTVIMFTTIRFYEKPDRKKAFLLGLYCGLATITRPTDIISVLIPLLWGVQNFKMLQERIRFLMRGFNYIGVFIIGALLFGSLQIISWKVTTGHFIFYSYEDQGFSWLHPHVKDGLFSYKKGWLVYTPFFIFLIPGFIFLYRKHRNLFYPAFIFCILNVYIAFSWDIWWYGGSLGQRSMVQSYAILSLPIAAFIEYIIQSRLMYKIGTGLFVISFILYNLIITLAAHGKYGVLDTENANRTYFWISFLKLKINQDDKKYLDTNEKFHGEMKNQTEIYFNDIENDLLHIDSNSVIGGRKCLYVNATEQQTQPYAVPLPGKNAKWLQVSADFYFPVKEWDIWRSAQYIIQFRQDEKAVKTKFIRVQRIMNPEEIKNLWYDVRIPDKEYNSIQIFLWNAGSETSVFMDNLKVVSFE